MPMPQQVVSSLKIFTALTFAGGVWIYLAGRDGDHTEWTWGIVKGLYYGGGVNGATGIIFSYFLWELIKARQARGERAAVLVVVMWFIFFNALARVLFTLAATRALFGFARWLIFAMSGVLVLSAFWVIWNIPHLYRIYQFEKSLPSAAETEAKIAELQAQRDALAAAKASAPEMTPEMSDVIFRAEEVLRSTEALLHSQNGHVAAASAARS